MPRGWIIGIVWRLACALLALVATATPALADSGLVGSPIQVCIAQGSAPAAVMARASYDCATPQRSFGPGDFWAMSRPLPAGTGLTPFRVRVASLWQDRLTLHALYADGAIVAMPLDGRATTRHIQLGAIVEQALPVRAGAPVVRLLWHVEGSANLRGILIGARIATPEQSNDANLLFGALYAAFAGLCIALIFYNLALWVALRHTFQLAYCAMVAGLLAYAVSSSGALAWFWPDIANTDRMRINYATLGFAAAAALVFARTFFERHVFAGWIDRAIKLLTVALIAASLAFATLAPWHIALLDHLYGMVFALELAIVPALLWQAWRRRSNYLWAFAIAWAAPILLAAIRVANTFHLVRYNFWVDNSTLGSMSVEALLSSMAIAYRIRLLTVERDEARAQEIEARLLADVDPLTGLINRRAFLREAIGRPGAQVLMLADIDHFKQVNETLGHDGGDEVLRIVARVLRAVTPAGGLVARIGGEEFAIVVHAADSLAAATILERIREERMPFDLAVTISIGVSTGTLASDIDWKALYRRADRALFEAKAAGRDRVRHDFKQAA